MCFPYVIFITLMEGVRNTAKSLFLELVGAVFCKALVGFSQAPRLKYMQYKTLMLFITYVLPGMKGAKGVGKVLRF